MYNWKITYSKENENKPEEEWNTLHPKIKLYITEAIIKKQDKLATGIKKELVLCKIKSNNCYQEIDTESNLFSGYVKNFSAPKWYYNNAEDADNDLEWVLYKEKDQEKFEDSFLKNEKSCMFKYNNNNYKVMLNNPDNQGNIFLQIKEGSSNLLNRQVLRCYPYELDNFNDITTWAEIRKK